MFLGDNTTQIYGKGMVTIKLLNGRKNKFLKFDMFLD
jgi:hypothetical protein